jgi:membrane protease YdiL (CAAX protease family)
MALPTLVTLAYFVWAAGLSERLQQAVYLVAKLIQFGFPIFWVCLVQRHRPSLRAVSWRGTLWGVVFGLLVLAAALALYHGWLKSTDFFVASLGPIHEKITDLGLDAAWKFAALGVFYSLCHSLLEEYYWRWFVFDQLSRLVPLGAAIVLSALGFMAHHVLVISAFFGIASPATWLLSAAVAMGGAFWAWLYHRTGSLLGPWISHMAVDAAIFAIGYDIARGLFAGIG